MNERVKKKREGGRRKGGKKLRKRLFVIIRTSMKNPSIDEKIYIIFISNTICWCAHIEV